MGAHESTNLKKTNKKGARACALPPYVLRAGTYRQFAFSVGLLAYNSYTLPLKQQAELNIRNAAPVSPRERLI